MDPKGVRFGKSRRHEFLVGTKELNPVVAIGNLLSVLKKRLRVGQKVIYNLIRLKGMPSCNKNVGSKPFC